MVVLIVVLIVVRYESVIFEDLELLVYFLRKVLVDVKFFDICFRFV